MKHDNTNKHNKNDTSRTSRKLDPFFFRVERSGKSENVCFSDLTGQERDKVLEGRDEEWLKSLCCGLADTIASIGEEFDITSET